MNTLFSRRQFLQTLTVVGAAALLPLAGTAALADAEAFVPVGAPGDFTEGDFKPVTLPGGALLFVGRSQGKLLALSSACTHRGCAVAWKADDKEFLCPCHRGRFDGAGKNIGGPPRSPLPPHAVKVEGDRVLVQA